MDTFYGRNNNYIDTTPFMHYNKQLQHYLHDYMEIIHENEYFNRRLHPNAREKAQKILRSRFDPTNLEFQKECDAIKDEIGTTTMEVFLEYNSIIMKTIGKIAECIIVDHCNNDMECNKKLINLAMLKEDINISDNTIPYHNYMAFSTSYKYTFKFDKEGYFSTYSGMKYSPCETTMDIAWCLQSNPLVCLMVAFYEGKKILKMDYAHLQIKATTNCSGLNLKNYPLTPIIVFDLDNNIQILKNRYPLFCIIPARLIKYQMQEELEYYYKLLLAYASGIIDTININDTELYTNERLQYLNGMSINEILTGELLGINKSNFLTLIKEQNKKIRIKEIILPL